MNSINNQRGGGEGEGEEEEPKLYETILLSLFSSVIALALYYLILGRRHVKKRQQLSHELQLAIQNVLELQEKLDTLEAEEASREILRKQQQQTTGGIDNNNNEIRVFMDGAFDMMHYGHMNAFRQGRSLGTYLVVGINTDASITQCKGTAPIMNDIERTAAVEACRWVDEVVKDCPYIMTSEYLSWVMKEYKIDYVVHGDDPCIVDGKDVYQEAKDRGVYKSIPRTEGVSTTEIVGRMLYISREHHDRILKSPELSGGLVSKTTNNNRRIKSNKIVIIIIIIVNW
jgi:ethanolamine-phosphate cytidylyltransferase